MILDPLKQVSPDQQGQISPGQQGQQQPGTQGPPQMNNQDPMQGAPPADQQDAPPTDQQGPAGGTFKDDPKKDNATEGELVNTDQVDITPQQQQQIDAYSDNATLVVFSKESQAAILQSLQSGKNPIDSVARTANIIHKRLASSLEAKGEEKMTEITMCLGAAHLVSELIVLADAAKLFKLNSQERLEAFRQTLMQYFHAGLADGSIDPVKLQQTVEPLMNKDQRSFGLQHADKSGIMKTAPPSGGMFKGQQPQPQQQQPQPQQPQQQNGILGGAANGI